MKIISSDTSFRAGYHQKISRKVAENFTLVSTPRPENQVPRGNPGMAVERPTDEFEHSGSISPRFLIMKILLEKVFDMKVDVFGPEHERADASGSPPSADFQNPGLSWDYTRTTSYSEEQDLQFNAEGVVRTGDGKEISFSLDLNVHWEYQSEETTRLSSENRKIDPLIINFEGHSAQLSDQRFAFDINSDGKAESISRIGSGSGFLALDLNGDGRVNNGSELFGPATGNGFEELRKYDSDRNGWIDENDRIFSELMIWSSDPEGIMTLHSLKEKNIGALLLDNVDVSFFHKDLGNNVLAETRKMGIFLAEDDAPGSIQQVDFYLSAPS